MSIDLYKYAAQNALRFASVRGDLTAEQLFSLPLTSKNGADLDTIAKSINADLKSVSEESFVKPVTNPRKPQLEVALELVKDVIATKQAEAAAELAKTKKAEERRKLLDALAAKKDQALSEKSIEALEAALTALD